MGIELVGIFDNEYQAEKIYSIPGNKTIENIPNKILLTLSGLQIEIVKKLNKLNSGKYDGFFGNTILLCNLTSPLIESNEVINYVERHSTFRGDQQFNKYFYEIWLMWKPRNTSSREFLKLE